MLSELPKELRQLIAAKLPTRNVLRLSCASKNLKKNCNVVLRGRTKRPTGPRSYDKKTGKHQRLFKNLCADIETYIIDFKRFELPTQRLFERAHRIESRHDSIIARQYKCLRSTGAFVGMMLLYYSRRNGPDGPYDGTPRKQWDRLCVRFGMPDAGAFTPKKSASWDVGVDRALEFGQWKFAKLKRAIQRRRLRESHLKRRGSVDGRVPLHRLMNGLKIGNDWSGDNVPNGVWHAPGARNL